MGKHGEYLYEVNEIVNETLRIVEQTRDKKNNRKAYVVQSLTYPNPKNNYTMLEGNLKKGCKCAYISGQRICEENSLYSYEHIRPYIVDIEYSKTIAPNNDNPITVKCECGKEKQTTPKILVRDSFSCTVCGIGLSYGQLAFNSYSYYFKLNYKFEITDLLKGRRFDAILYNQSDIINIVEIQGRQHTEKNHEWHGDSHAQDSEKRKFCKENNILLIEIDMRISSWGYFKEQINKCEQLPNINEADEKEILKIMKDNKRYDVKEIIRLYEVENLTLASIGEKYNRSSVTIANILKRNGVVIRPSGKSRTILIDENEVCKMYLENVSVSNLAKEFNCTQGKIYRVLKNHNVTRSHGTNRYNNKIS